jgi:ubiquinone biosynthesis protein
VKTFGMNARRLLHIARVLLAHGFAHLVARYASRWPWLVGRVALAKLPGPQRFRRLFEDLGGSFIKFGQMLALQPDILSIEYCNALFDLLDRIAPFPFAHVELVFREELGRTPAQLFDRFDTEPFSTASIGQVHVAYLRGQKVAVKVQRPAVDIEFAGDIRLLLFGMRLIRRLGVKSLFWLIPPMGEFAAWTHEELDYRCEARYADRLRRNARNNPVERIPAVYWSLTTRRTLVMEFIEGVTALEYLRAEESGDAEAARKIRANELDRNRFSRHIIDNFVGDVFRHGVFHADLHPANLLVLPGEVVGYVDFGITGVLSPYSRRHLVELTLALARGDIEGMTNVFFKLAVIEAHANPTLFRRRMAEVAPTWYAVEGSETVMKTNFTTVMLDMLLLCRETGVVPERDVVKYIRSSIAADGLITRLAPGFNVGRYLETACQVLVGRDLQRAMLSWETFGTVMTATGHLIENGAARASSVLRQIADGEITAQLDVTSGGDPDALRRRRTLRLAGLVVALTALLELTGGPASFGFNIVTVEALLAGIALVMLLDSVVRLARRD